MTLAEAQDHLDRARAAYNKALDIQEYSITGPTGGGRQIKRPDLDVLAAEVTRWDATVTRLSRGGMRVRRGVPL